MEAGGRIGISSRGVGNGQTNNEGVLVIGESYKLITFDAVADPSTYAAFQQPMNKVSSKRENFEPVKPIVENHNVNSKAFVSYFGLALDNQMQSIKKDIRKKA
jgi:hypothetical protein